MGGFGILNWVEITLQNLRGRLRYDDDMPDRLNHRWTSFILIALTVVTSGKIYFWHPLQCWVPAEYTDNMEEYAERVCWISNTYYQPFNMSNPQLPQPHVPKSEKGEIAYYQWVPVILLVQAFCFHLPALFWRIVIHLQGVNVNEIVIMARDPENLITSIGDKTTDFVVKHLDAYLCNTREYRRGKWARIKQKVIEKTFIGKRAGRWLLFFFLFTKVLYMVNIILQFAMLETFIGDGFHTYGWDVMSKIIRGLEWRMSPMFPSVILCDFQIRVLANIHRHTIQCTLSINYFNELMYAALWFWFMTVAMLTLYGIAYWSCSFSLAGQKQFIMKYLECSLTITKENKESERKFYKAFIENHLRPDGVFVLKLLFKNTDHMFAEGLVCELYKHFKRHHREMHSGLPNAESRPKSVTFRNVRERMKDHHEV